MESPVAELLVLNRPRTLSIERERDRAPGPLQVRVRTHYSGISAGTELAAYRGSSPHLHKAWDDERRLFKAPDRSVPPYPVRTWGYEEVGEIIECGPGVSGLQEGQLVFGTWGHRTEAVLDGSYVQPRVLPVGLDPLLGIYSHIGPIALNGVHDARIHVGETVAVFGLGVVGQVVAQLARASGARVIGVDRLENRLNLAHELEAAELLLNVADGEVGERIKQWTEGRGADVAIEVTGSTTALHEAIRSVAYAARVVAMGFFQGEAQGLYLGEEFHHNRVQIVGSQISGVAPERALRWDRLRLVHTTMRLQLEGVLRLRPLITHIVPFHEAAEAFRLLDESPAGALQVVLDFREG
jgi:threonine dehydrogenase-like Zn-dependent dehydrogenase